MEDDRISEMEIVIREVLLGTCQLRKLLNEDYLHASFRCMELARDRFRCRSSNDVEYGYIPLITGSVAELYLEPMLSCVGDVDIMCHRSNQLAIPVGYSPPTQLPGEFYSRVVKVYEITDSEFPGYVYLWLSYRLIECVDDGKHMYNMVQCEHSLPASNGSSDAAKKRHGPALLEEQRTSSIVLTASVLSLHRVESLRSIDKVFCMRCLLWPPQAADWPTRHRNYDWPDSATVDRVVNNGCDVVGVAHLRCRQDEYLGKHQWRLSFSRAEVVLLNTWVPVQQTVYHMLRVFMKTEQLTDSNSSSSGAHRLSNYHIKTLLLWACELKSRSWWADDLNLVRICVELLSALAVQLTDERCQHILHQQLQSDRFKSSTYTQTTVDRLMSTATRARFCRWCIDSYIQKCAERCPSSVSRLLQDHSSITPHDRFHRLQKAVSEIEMWRLNKSVELNFTLMTKAQYYILGCVSWLSLTLQSYLCWMHLLPAKSDQLGLPTYFTAVVFLHGAYKTGQGSLTDEMLDVLATTCLQLTDARSCLNARHSSVLSLYQAVTLMKVVARNSHSTVLLIQIELSKAYFYRALRCRDSYSSSIYCLANVCLAVLYYTTEQYQTAIDHCKLVTRLGLCDHSQCSSRIVGLQGELLPCGIDKQVENILGLAVFYQNIRASALNEEQELRHVGAFTAELFAHYLHIKFLSVLPTACRRQLPQLSLSDEIQRYQNYVCSFPEMFVTDVMLFRSTHCAQYPASNDQLMADRLVSTPETLRHLDTSKLVELLQQSAVEHLTTCREFDARNFDSVITPDFRAPYAYKCGQYQHCLQLSVRNVCQHIANRYNFYLFVWPVPELLQLLDDEIISLIGLAALVGLKRKTPSHTVLLPLLPFTIHQLSLSLYLITQCQIKLRHPVTSLATSLNYVRFTRFIKQMLKHVNSSLLQEATLPNGFMSFDQIVLKFVERKITRYMAESH